jgi:hypothetical protein
MRSLLLDKWEELAGAQMSLQATYTANNQLTKKVSVLDLKLLRYNQTKL